MNRREEDEADAVINKATNNLIKFFANKDMGKDENWREFDEKFNPHTQQKIQQQQQRSGTTSTQKPANKSVTTNNYEELEKLARLKDMGIITQEEFDFKKRELLGMSQVKPSSSNELTPIQVQRLEKLKQFREQGILTTKEYEIKRQEVLNMYNN